MNQLQAMLEKAKTDKVLMDKLEELGRKNAVPEEIIAFAADHGFTITANDLEVAACGKIGGELNEEQLDQISGGFIYPTENRFDPNVCPGLTRTRYECVGLFQFCNCDHYKRELFGTGKYSYWHYCNTNGFKAYKGDYAGNPDPS